MADDVVRTPRRSSSRNAGGRTSVATLMPTAHERILNDVHNLYVNNSDLCLKSIAQLVNQNVLPPRRRINVLLVGNHSAGKSSFINWYVEEHIQRTGVAIETQGITLVVSGKKRETLRGDATLKAFKRFEFLEDIEGVVDYLTTEVSTSRQKRFPLVTFIDTPGLVDGGVQYAFDVERTILKLGNQADLIFVFFDPIGQALCKRTMDLVERLNMKHGDKLKFYLSKADEAGVETDRQRVMMQIVQELCRRPGLNKAGFDMPTIYIPNPSKPSRCVNQIEDTCSNISKAIDQTVQSTLGVLLDDAQFLTKVVDTAFVDDQIAAEQNRKSRVKRLVGALLSVVMAFFCVLNLWVVFPAVRTAVAITFGSALDKSLKMRANALIRAWDIVPEDWRVFGLTFAVVISSTAAWCIFDSSAAKPRLTRKKRRQFQDARDHLQQTVLPKQSEQRFASDFEVADKGDTSGDSGMSVDDEAAAFIAAKRTGRRNAVPHPELSHAVSQMSEDMLPDLAKQLSLSDDPMDASGKPSDSSQPSTSAGQTSQSSSSG